ncbi:MAG: ATP-binding cassette domain-containing protein [Thermoanaerobaculia bacterium]|nr:ATP-binding cassette domain-containing protein [Thermoanaerobaculia bacterium]
MTPAPDPGPLLSVRGLSKTFRSPRPVLWGGIRREVRAVSGVSFDVEPGRTLALVGESGSGKSTTARLVLRLLAPDSGEVRFAGRDWLSLPLSELNRARRDVGVVFQDPGRSLSPRMSVGSIVGEPLTIHGIGTADERRERVSNLLRAVGLPDLASSRRPEELSGGQRQRVAIARALATEPKLVVLDEPVSALDVSIRAQVLNLLLELQETTPSRPAFLFIGHDLGVVRHLADRTAVMYLGRIVEEGPTEEVLGAPRHPYTALLLASRPGRDRRGDPEAAQRRRMAGEPASPASPPPGCAFHPRCPRAGDRCRTDAPGETTGAGNGGRRFACHDPEPLAEGNFSATSS